MDRSCVGDCYLSSRGGRSRRGSLNQPPHGGLVELLEYRTLLSCVEFTGTHSGIGSFDPFTGIFVGSGTGSVTGVVQGHYTMQFVGSGTLSSGTFSGTVSGAINGSYSGSYTGDGSGGITTSVTYNLQEGAATGTDQYTMNLQTFSFAFNGTLESETNEPPQFAPLDELDTGEIELPAGALRFEDGWVLGQLGAFDPDGDDLTFSGSSPYFLIDADGFIEVIDGVGLTAYFDDAGKVLTVPVTVTDGCHVVESEFVLSSATGWIDQSEIYVLESNGTEHTPDTADELIDVMEGIQNRGNTVTNFIIKGHGSSDGIAVGDNGEFLTTAGSDIYIGDEDVTELLNDITGDGTTISLRGCFSHALAKRVRDRLDGASVYGAVRFVIGIPGTTWGIGIYR